jgi:hypothetical protein
MSHKKTCFISRLKAGMRIWDLRNPEPNEAIETEEWIQWYEKRCQVEIGGIGKIAHELGMLVESGLDVPCTCEKAS